MPRRVVVSDAACARTAPPHTAASVELLRIVGTKSYGGSWAKERAGGAFAAGLAFILINRLTGSIFGVTSDILADKAATVHTVFGQSIKVSDYFISVLEAPALNMGVFVGIISGFIGATPTGGTDRAGVCLAAARHASGLGHQCDVARSHGLRLRRRP